MYFFKNNMIKKYKKLGSFCKATYLEFSSQQLQIENLRYVAYNMHFETDFNFT